MSGSFSLVEKLALAGAFCAIVAMGVGTEEEPGVVAASPQAVVKPQPTQAAATTSAPARGNGWWFVPGGGRDAAAEDERGSIGVEKAPEPPPRAF